MYHTVRYQMNYVINSRLRDFFEVELDTGLVYVNYTTDAVLDRDGDEPEHRVFLTIFDNFYSEGGETDFLLLIVLATRYTQRASPAFNVSEPPYGL